MSRKLIQSSLIISFGLLLGRLMGLVREAVVASAFGVSTEADIAVLALTIPDILINILVSGGLSAALIPEFKSMDKDQAYSLFLQVSLVMGALFSVLALVLGFVPHILISLFSPGLSEQASLSAQDIITSALWLIPLTTLAGITTAFLQSHEKFAIPAMGTVIFNSCVVFGLLAYVKETKNLEFLVFFIILGGLLRWGSQLYAMRGYISRSGVFAKFMVHKAIFHRYWQAVMAVGLISLYPVVARSFASFSGEGALALVNYSWRLVELPLGLVITVLAVVLFPKLSAMHANNDEAGFSYWLGEGLLWSLILSFSVLGPVLAFPETFVRMAFGWGEIISEFHLHKMSQFLQIAILVLPGSAVIAMSVAAFNAKKDTMTPVKYSLFGFFVLVPLCFFGQEKYGLTGIFVALIFSYLVVGIGLLTTLQRQNMGILKWSMLAVPTLTGVVSYLFAVGFMKIAPAPASHPLSLIPHIILLGMAMVLALAIVGIVTHKVRIRTH